MSIQERFAGKLRDLEITVSGEGRCALAALSGGGDSTALLLLAAEAAAGGGRKDGAALELHAARVNHGIRPDDIEAAETALTADLCASLNVPFRDLRTEPGQIDRLSRGRGVEQAARTERHRLLENHRRCIGADVILFGHTADDQFETLLMRILSGSGPEGLKGIPERRGPIRRPLLGESRESLRGLLRSRDIRWAEDAGNSEKRYRRSRIRNELLPLIEDIFPGRISALRMLARRSSEAAEALAVLRERELPLKCEPGSAGSGKSAGGDGSERAHRDICSFERAHWERCPPYLRALGLLEAFNILCGSDEPDRRIPWRLIDAARCAVDEHRSMQAPGCMLTSEGGRITLCRPGRKAGEGRIVLGQAETEAGLQFPLGPLTVRAGRFADAGGPDGQAPPRIFPINKNQWPVSITLSSPPADFTLHSNRGARITERLFESLSHDDPGEMFYIQIDYDPEAE